MNITTRMVAAGDSKLSDGYDKVWGAVPSDVQLFMAVAGVLLLIVAIFKYFYDKSRGGGQGKVVFFTLVVAGILAAPSLIIPLLLDLADLVLKFIVDLIN